MSLFIAVCAVNVYSGVCCHCLKRCVLSLFIAVYVVTVYNGVCFHCL